MFLPADRGWETTLKLQKMLGFQSRLVYAAVVKTFCYAFKLPASLDLVAIERGERHYYFQQRLPSVNRSERGDLKASDAANF